MVRQLPLLFAALALAACDTLSSFGTSSSKVAESTTRIFAGGVAGDEPQSVIAGRDALAAGGTAADAAATMFFALSATLPSSASLGSGGMCIAFDPQSGRVEALDFVTRSPRVVPPSSDRPNAIPGSPIGFWALHARYGKLPWSQIVAPGERFARLGVPASRILISDMAPVVAPLLEDPESRRIFADATGRPIGEGALFAQPDLARVLATIRISGIGDMYKGKLANELVAAANAAGGSLDLQDLESYKPAWLPTLQVKFGTRVAHFAPPPAVAGALEAQMFGLLADRGRFDGGNNVERLHVVAEAGLRAFADRARWMRDDMTASDPLPALVSEATLDRLTRNFEWQRHTPPTAFNPPPVARPENPSATSFVALDRDGAAVACALTMNNNFGTGRMARGTGIMLAAVPNAQGRGPTSLGPMAVINPFTKQFFFAAAASGGVAAPTALINVAAHALLADEPIEAAMKAKRIHHGGAPDITYYEPGIPREDIMALTQRGHTVAATPILGIVNAIKCANGMPRRPDECSLIADPRGNGIALSFGR